MCKLREKLKFSHLLNIQHKILNGIQFFINIFDHTLFPLFSSLLTQGLAIYRHLSSGAGFPNLVWHLWTNDHTYSSRFQLDNRNTFILLP
jgi:hypothetical protein